MVATTVGGALSQGVAGAAESDVEDDGHVDGELAEIASVGDFDDKMFDWAAAEGGAWAVTRYGVGDQRGTLNEITSKTTARALKLLEDGGPVMTYNLGELMWNGFPAFITRPPRIREQRLTAWGYPKPADFIEVDDWTPAKDAANKANGGLGMWLGATPIGENRVSVHEERFPLGGTYQIATQLDGLGHVGVGNRFYGGYTGADIAKPYGQAKLGNEHIGPIVTRGIVLDILELKISQGATSALSKAANGKTILTDNYRITIDDIQKVMERHKIKKIRPGDVVLFRTGWPEIVRDTVKGADGKETSRYAALNPGPYLAECRWLAQFRPAIIGSDTWAFEVLGNEVVKHAFPCHQLLLAKEGIRIGEAFNVTALADDGVTDFLFLYNPEYALGATAGNAAPFALARKKDD